MTRQIKQNPDSKKLLEYIFIVKKMLNQTDDKRINELKNSIKSGNYLKTKEEIRQLAEILNDIIK